MGFVVGMKIPLSVQPFDISISRNTDHAKEGTVSITFAFFWKESVYKEECHTFSLPASSRQSGQVNSVPRFPRTRLFSPIRYSSALFACRASERRFVRAYMTPSLPQDQPDRLETFALGKSVRQQKLPLQSQSPQTDWKDRTVQRCHRWPRCRRPRL